MYSTYRQNVTDEARSTPTKVCGCVPAWVRSGGGYCWEKVEYLPLVGFFIGVAALYLRMLGSLAYVSWEDGPPNTTQEPFFI